MADDDVEEFEEEDAAVNSNLERGQNMEGERISPGTKKIYASKMKQVTAFFRDESKLSSVMNDNGQVDFALLTSPHASEFLGYISVKRNRQGIQLVPKQIQAYETVSSYWSAIKYTASVSPAVVIDAVVIKTILHTIKGYRREVQQAKMDDEMKSTEGKCPLNFSTLSFLASTAMFSAFSFQLSIFAHLFLLLCWNLIARSVSISSLMYSYN